MPRSNLLQAVEHLALAAAQEVMAVYAAPFAVSAKADDSPVTEADQRAEAVILRGLAGLEPGVPVVAEEAVAAGQGPVRIDGDTFWLVDPLDGTREFIARNGEFTVNIALIQQGRPVLGVVLAPALDGPQGWLYAGAEGLGAWQVRAGQRQAIACRAVPPQGLTVVASRSHGDQAALQAYLAGRHVAALHSVGSSLKLCTIASGQADLYPRLGRTMEWDIAAGHAVLAAAGGRVTRLDNGQPLSYGKPGFENPHFVAAGLAA